MLRKIVQLFVVLPLAILLVVFAVANRHFVTLSLDPFGGDSPALSLQIPLFLLFFLALILGVLIGGVAAWFGQGKWRRRARHEHDEAARWRSRAAENARRANEAGDSRAIVPTSGQRA